MTIQDRIRNRIKGRGRGAVFTPKDFLDLGRRAAVDQSLSRMVKDGTIRRLRRGVYDFPKKHPRLGVLSPDGDAVARALVGDAPLQLSGAAAANALGLSTQVPARTIYYSDRSFKDVPVGNRVISVRKASPRQLAGARRPSGPVLQALRYLGKDRVDDGVVSTLRDRLSQPVKDDLEAYAEMTADPEVMRYIADGRTQSYPEARAWVEGCIAQQADIGYSRYAVVLKESGNLIGFCGFAEFNGDLDFGWRLERRSWHKGDQAGGRRMELRLGMIDLPLSDR